VRPDELLGDEAEEEDDVEGGYGTAFYASSPLFTGFFFHDPAVNGCIVFVWSQ